jgi:hypothetical protein
MSTLSLTSALAVAAALGLSFRTTRTIGIAASAGLCCLHPWLGLIPLIATALYLMSRFRR